MKKVLACLLVVVLAFCMTVISVSAATPSPETNGIVSGIKVTDKNDQTVSFKLNKIDGKVTQEFQTELKELKKETNDDTLKVVAQYDATVADNAEFPVSVTLDVLGVSASSKVYVMVKERNNGALKVFETTLQKGKITFTLDAPIESLAITTDKATAAQVEKENNVLSPQTSDASTFVIIAGVLSVLALGFVFKKVKA